MTEVYNKEIVKLSEDSLAEARSLIIGSNDDYVAAGARREALREIEKKIEETFDPLIDQAHKHHKALVAEKKRHAEPVEEARKLLKAKMFAWEDAQEKIRREEEARLAAEAKVCTDTDALKAAEAAESEGNAEIAAAILEDAAAARPIVILPKETPKIAGHSRRTVRKFRIKNPTLVKRDYLALDLMKIGGVVRALGKAAEAAVGGIEVYEEAV